MIEYREIALEDIQSVEHFRQIRDVLHEQDSNLCVRIVCPSHVRSLTDMPDRQVAELADSIVSRSADGDHYIKDRSPKGGMPYIIPITNTPSKPFAMLEDMYARVAKAHGIPALMLLNTIPRDGTYDIYKASVDKYLGDIAVHRWALVTLGPPSPNNNRWSYYHRARKYIRKAKSQGTAGLRNNIYTTWAAINLCIYPEDVVENRNAKHRSRAEKYGAMYKWPRAFRFNIDDIMSPGFIDFQSKSRLHRDRHLSDVITYTIIDESYVLKRHAAKSSPSNLT